MHGALSASLALVLALTACSSDSTKPQTTTIGPQGGTVHGPNGAKIVVPPGALSKDTALSIAKVDTGFPSGTAALAPKTDVYAFTPHGQTFSAPVTVSVPSSATGSGRTLISAQPNGSWATVPGAKVVGAAMEASVKHFSFFSTAAQPADAGPPADAGDTDGAARDTNTASADTLASDGTLVGVQGVFELLELRGETDVGQNAAQRRFRAGSAFGQQLARNLSRFKSAEQFDRAPQARLTRYLYDDPETYGRSWRLRPGQHPWEYRQPALPRRVFEAVVRYARRGRRVERRRSR